MPLNDTELRYYDSNVLPELKSEVRQHSVYLENRV